ncbi:hypothetical protein KV395_00190 [Microbacterium luteolum]|uniref:AbiTii domain-containing protein n=1 Tax=Microbacterium luteolum TaxID=69367 RepID=A0ABY7XIE0_MICLT|nr:hypothetical protein [Microbacterium luteolum]WDM41777.1 hypothetical protein KV395_00190 [Microbacterium luteolum]
MESSERIARAIDNTLAAVAANSPTTVICRSALRVATLRQDTVAEFWLRMEVQGLGDDSKERNRLLLARLTAEVGTQEAMKQWERAAETFQARRTVEQGGKNVILSQSVGELETNLASMVALHEDEIPAGMTPIDVGLAYLDRKKARTSLYVPIALRRSMLERTKDAAYTYVLDVEAQILAGETVPDSVARGREFVETELARRAPKALEALRAAESRSDGDGHEATSHAATSCRRAIKALADALYPPGAPVTGEDGLSRLMDDDHYRNRLTAWVLERRGRSTHADLLASNLVSLGTRLKSLDDLASKGVHADLSRAEVESCVSWVYMLAADLLRVDVQANS